MEHKNHDKVFYKTFGMVLGALFGIFFICIIAARIIDSGEIHDDGRGLERMEARIKPIGTVVTDPAVLVEMAKANKVERKAYTGEEVHKKVCGACHDSGMLGAPKTGDKAAWSARLKSEGGLDGLVAMAIKGKNAMPPRGGDADLSDDEVKAAVEVLMK